MTETPRRVPTHVQSHIEVTEIRTLYVRFKNPVTLGNVAIVAPLREGLTILWVTDMAGNAWVREGVFWWTTITGWTPDVTVGVEGDGDVGAVEFSGVSSVDRLPAPPVVA